MSEPIRVLIAGDHPLIRQGVAHSLASGPDMALVGEAASWEEALRLARNRRPDCPSADHRNVKYVFHALRPPVA